MATFIEVETPNGKTLVDLDKVTIIEPCYLPNGKPAGSIYFDGDKYMLSTESYDELAKRILQATMIGAKRGNGGRDDD